MDALVVLHFFFLHNGFREALVAPGHMPLKLFFTYKTHLKDQTAAFAFGLGFARFAMCGQLPGICKGPVAGRAAIRSVRLVVVLGRL